MSDKEFERSLPITTIFDKNITEDEIENFILPQKLDPRALNANELTDGIPGYRLSDDSVEILNTCIEKCRLYGNLLINICEDPVITQNALSDLGSEILLVASMIREVMEMEEAVDINGE